MAGAGVQRPLKFAKYLPEFGWEPIILTVKGREYYEKDETFLKEIPSYITIKRTKSFENSHIPNTILIPDRKIGWLPFAYHTGLKTIEQYKIDVIYSTSGPYTSHLIGYLLKKKTGLPWIADFRDEWTQHPYIKYKTSFHKKINRWLEKKILLDADEVISVSEPITMGLRNLIEEEDHNKFHTITNGYDKNDFLIEKNNNDRIFKITYVGSFYGLRTPKHFFDAIDLLWAEKKINPNDFKIVFVGTPFHMNHQFPDNLIQSIGYVTHIEALNYMMNSTVLLLVMPNDKAKNAYTGKIFEYIASGKSILALVPKEGVAAELINETKTGLVTDPEDAEQIKNAILYLYTQWHKDNLIIEPRWDLINKYERKILTKNLSSILDDCILNRKSK